MATPETIRTQLKRVLAAYPQHAARLTDGQIVDMLDVWQEDLIDLDDNLLAAAIKNHRERSQWLPSIAEIRASAVSLMRQASPADQDWNEAYAELQRLIGSVGYVNKPNFTNPALAETVRTLGGWQAVCWNEDLEGVFRGQFRDVYQVVIARMERKVTQSPEVRAFIASMTPHAPQIEAPDALDVIRQLAEAKRAQ
jgi:hypothetical protein